MTDTEMDQLENFLGHDIRIHREFYRLPEKTLQLAKISKVLMALEQGRLSEFHGKNLDEIGIDPDEPPAEVVLPPTERNMSPPPKRSKPSSQKQMSGASAMRPPCKGKTTQKRTPWQQAEVQAVERHLKQCIVSGTVPSKSDCEKCLKAEPEALRNRDWKTVKFYVYNRITAFKKKLQCRELKIQLLVTSPCILVHLFQKEKAC
ncbi:N-lysine methyltransferase SETD8 [Labeo rohita]|uniref:N-lysine methyltransferase SETD8 n=1 Tax=Labeo rohita TaxID=84645 RepID=A0A498P264_LABRO|nr:N-lysine methyltransferase SETD8 [Labeo rohita]RXN37909.1 N-lysine methyltransferase SETD8 [Labeo rohita]